MRRLGERNGESITTEGYFLGNAELEEIIRAVKNGDLSGLDEAYAKWQKGCRYHYQ